MVEKRAWDPEGEVRVEDHEAVAELAIDPDELDQLPSAPSLQTRSLPSYQIMLWLMLPTSSWVKGRNG